MNWKNIINKLTPIEEHNGVFFKREDLFRPFKDMPLNGGKVRQALALVSNNLEVIKDKHDGVIATCSSVHSPQGIIIAKIAKIFGLKAVLGIGNSEKNVSKVCEKHYNMSLMRDLGCEIHVLAGIGYNTVLNSRLLKLYPDAFIIDFGMNYEEDKTSIIDCISNQVQNIPDDIDNLVIPVGSAITTCGILNGIKEYDKKIKNIYLIQIAGYDRFEKMKDILQTVNYENFMIFNRRNSEINTTIKAKIFNIASKDYPYTKLLDIKFGDVDFMDKRYEAKALDYMVKHIKPKGKTLFWVIGDASWLYKKE